MANKTKTQPEKSVTRDEVQVESLGDGAVKMPRQALSVQLATETLDEENRTIDATFYSGAQVMRMNWWTGEKWMLQFSMEKSAIRMARLNSGAPVLNQHSDWSLSDILGVVEKGWLEDGKGKARIRFSDREDVEPVWRDVKNKIIRNVSMGAAVHKLKDVTPDESKIKHYLAVDWEPMEVSVVGIGADPGAGFLKAEHEQFTTCEVEHAEQRATAQKENLMEEQLKDTGSAPVVAAREEPKKATNTDPVPAVVDLAAIKAEAATTERLRIDGIQKAIQLANSKLGAKLDEVFCQRLISNGTSVADARTEIFNKLAEQSETNPIRTANVQVTRDADVTRLDAMENQILHRLGPNKVKLESGRQYVNYTLFDLTKEILSAHGVSHSGKSKLDVVSLAYQTTSDFPNLIGNVAHRRLRQAYEEVLPTYRLWARRAPNAPDFKSMTVIQLGAAPDLLRVNEHGEFKYAKVSDGAETYSMVTYGRILAFTRQAIINDDLRGFDRITTGFGSAAARLENQTVYAELTNNANLSDGVPLFHATHNNLVSPGTVINVANLGIARGKMRAQTGVDGEALNLVPRYLIVPAALEQVAYQYTSNQFVPATPANTNEFRQGGRTALEPIVDGLLDANSAIKWYLAAEGAQIDTVEYCFLDGNEGVFLEQRQGFNIDGMEFKARLDFAAKNLDFRGLVRNDGA